MNRIRSSARVAILCTGLLGAGAANATVWDVDGAVELCNDLLCGLADITSGDPIAGFLKANSGASGPGSTFTESDITDYRLDVGGFSVGTADGSIDVATITTGPDGEIVSGNLEISGTVDGGIFGLIDFLLTVDLGLGTFSITTTYSGLGEVANGPVLSMLELDGDELAAIEDNCTDVANADQRDTDSDGYGNVCDPDLNNDDVVDFGDLPAMQQAFFSQDGDPNWNPDADISGDGVIDFGDLPIFQSLFFQPPGPSGLVP